MEIFQHKENQDSEVEKFLNIFHLPNVKAILTGSALYKNLLYKSDYDLWAYIQADTPITKFYPALTKVLNDIDTNQEMYFIEMKYHTKNDLKIRYYPGDIISQQELERHYSNLKFVKIDVVVRIRNKFYEISCMYSFENNINETQKDTNQRLEDDIKELKQENKYFKVLKRMFSIAMLKNNVNFAQFLMNVFNSDLGKKYEVLCNLKAMELVNQHYHDQTTKERLKINYGLIHQKFNLNGINILIHKFERVINNEAKNIYEKLKNDINYP
jgi:predicted nucleotidyltransferase